MQKTRGIISNRDRARQIRNYKGLRYGNITPTDIDGLIEYKNKGYIIIELKYEAAELPLGQQLALERLTDDLERSGKSTICIVASHQEIDCNKDIDVANTFVSNYRLKGNWYTPNIQLTTKQLIEKYLMTLPQ